MVTFKVDGREVEVDAKRVLTNDVTFQWESNPHNVRLWLIGNEYGVMGAVWADCEQDALDELVDADLGAGILIDESDADEECARLGNAGEPACLDNCRLEAVDLDKQTQRLLCAFAEARGAEADTLYDYF